MRNKRMRVTNTGRRVPVASNEQKEEKQKLIKNSLFHFLSTNYRIYPQKDLRNKMSRVKNTGRMELWLSFELKKQKKKKF